MIPNEPIQFSPIMPQHVAAPLFLEHLLDERSSGISVSNRITPCTADSGAVFYAGTEIALFLFHIPCG